MIPKIREKLSSPILSSARESYGEEWHSQNHDDVKLNPVTRNTDYSVHFGGPAYATLEEIRRDTQIIG